MGLDGASNTPGLFTKPVTTTGSNGNSGSGGSPTPAATPGGDYTSYDQGKSRANYKQFIATTQDLKDLLESESVTKQTPDEQLADGAVQQSHGADFTKGKDGTVYEVSRTSVAQQKPGGQIEDVGMPWYHSTWDKLKNSGNLSDKQYDTLYTHNQNYLTSHHIEWGD